MTIIKDRLLNDNDIQKGDLIAFHWNSNRNLYSILKMNSEHTVGLVIGYAENVFIENAYFVFQESKRKYTVETGKKERHSFIVGSFITFEEKNDVFSSDLYYNPMILKKFVDGPAYFNEGEIISFDHLKEIYATSTIRNNRKVPFISYNN